VRGGSGSLLPNLLIRSSKLEKVKGHRLQMRCVLGWREMQVTPIGEGAFMNVCFHGIYVLCLLGKECMQKPRRKKTLETTKD
jgi:hypothetical protein